MPKRILVVDDSKDFAEALRLWFHDRGIVVETADNGAEGLVQLRDRPAYDLIVLDMKMPIVGGAKFLELLPQRPPPVILVTGSDDSVPMPGCVRHVVRKGGDFDAADFEAKVMEVLACPS